MSKLIRVKVSNDKKSWIQSFRGILVGLSFLIAALVQITIFYYSHTLHEIPFYMKLLIIWGIGGIGIFMTSIIFPNLIENARKNLPRKMSGKYNLIWQSSLAALIIAILFSIHLSIPKAVFTYGFECPDTLYNSSKIKFNIKNEGQIWGEYKFYITSTNDNVSLAPEAMVQQIPPHSEQTYTNEIFVIFKERFPKNTTIYNNFHCLTSDCDVKPFFGSENICPYKSVGTTYLEKIK